MSRRMIRLALVILLSAAWSLTGVSSAGGPASVEAQQAYKTLPIADGYKDRRDLTPKRAIKSRVLAQGFGTDQAQFLDWYSGYVFRQMTLPEHFDALVDMRLEVVDDLRRAARIPAVHRELLNLTYTAMKVLATKTKAADGTVEQFHPWTRYNAILLAGALNAREPNTFDINRTPALPLPEAVEFLMGFLRDPEETDTIRLAAMIGLMRHAELDRTSPGESIPQVVKDELSNMMLALATAKDPPPGRTADGHVWLRRRAIDMLATLGSPGANGRIVAAMDAILADESEAVSLRCTVAEALDRFTYTDPAAVTVNALECGQKIGLLAAHVCRSEDLRVKAENELAEKRAAATPAGFAGFGGFGGSSGEGFGAGGGDASEGESYGGAFGSSSEPKAPVDFRREHSIRRLKHALNCALLGLRGEKKRTSIVISGTAPQATGPGGIAQLAADDAQRGEITKIEAALEALLAATDVDETATLDDMMKDLRLKTVALEALLPRKPAIADVKPADDPTAKPAADDPGAPADEPGRGRGPDEPGMR